MCENKINEHKNDKNKNDDLIGYKMDLISKMWDEWFSLFNLFKKQSKVAQEQNERTESERKENLLMRLAKTLGMLNEKEKEQSKQKENNME